ncbi:MAG: hypothetical protein M3N53_04765 [Actinomycetota bacterium]|nr:hypothetical protein [Actinomycetota bacterium]
MAALAYLLLPVSGLAAYLLGADARTRFHGLQAILIGLLWPLALYAASSMSAALTRVVFVAGVTVWLLLIVVAASGRDITLPAVGRYLERLSREDPRGGG